MCFFFFSLLFHRCNPYFNTSKYDIPLWSDCIYKRMCCVCVNPKNCFKISVRQYDSMLRTRLQPTGERKREKNKPRKGKLTKKPSSKTHSFHSQNHFWIDLFGRLIHFVLSCSCTFESNWYWSEAIEMTKCLRTSEKEQSIGWQFMTLVLNAVSHFEVRVKYWDFYVCVLLIHCFFSACLILEFHTHRWQEGDGGVLCNVHAEYLIHQPTGALNIFVYHKFNSININDILRIFLRLRVRGLTTTTRSHQSADNNTAPNMVDPMKMKRSSRVLRQPRELQLGIYDFDFNPRTLWRTINSKLEYHSKMQRQLQPWYGL